MSYFFLSSARSPPWKNASRSLTGGWGARWMPVSLVMFLERHLFYWPVSPSTLRTERETAILRSLHSESQPDAFGAQYEPQLGATAITQLVFVFLRFSTTTILGGGYILAQEQKTETQEEFNKRMENPGALLIQTSIGGLTWSYLVVSIKIVVNRVLDLSCSRYGRRAGLKFVHLMTFFP